jgi:drug/metabolite transporter (DMT)-like permease
MLQQKGVLGQLLIIAGACAFSLANGFVKLLLDDNVSKWSLLFIRGAATTVLNLAVMYQLHGVDGLRRAVLGIPEETTDPDQIAHNARFPGISIYIRGVVGTLSTTVLIIVYDRFMTFSDAFAIFLGLVTVFSNVLAAFVLREHVHIATLVGGAVCILGIVLVAQPPFIFGHKDPSTSHLYPTVTGLVLLSVAALFCSTAILFTRALNGRAPQSLLHGFMSVMGLEGLAAITVVHLSSTFPHTWGHWTYAILYIVCGQVGQYLSAAGFKYENMSVGSVLANMEMGFAFLIDAVMIHEHVTWVSVFGAVIIFAGGAIVAFRAQLSSAILKEPPPMPILPASDPKPTAPPCS